MYILHNGMYFVEGREHGTCSLTRNKDNATECIDLKDCEAHILGNMQMKLWQVAIKDEDRTLRNVNGIWYDWDKHYQCDRCGYVYYRVSANHVNTINGEELMCGNCYTDMETYNESYTDILEEI